MKRLVFVLLVICSTASGEAIKAASGEPRKAAPREAIKDDFHDLVKPSVFAITRVMMHDVVNPPAASRFYAYCMLGAYAIIAHTDSTFPSPSKFLNVPGSIPNQPDNSTGTNLPGRSADFVFPDSAVRDDRTINYRVAALFCILETARQMLPSGYMIEDDLKTLETQLNRRKVPVLIIKASREFAMAVSSRVTKFAVSDNYGRLSAKLRYTPRRGEGFWYPTPPAYMEAIEPNWKTIQPLMMDSCNQFVPAPPVPYSQAPDSDFYKLAHEVYTKGKNLDAELLAIASFWDCNPFAVENAGHLSLGFKKISPGGHWMNIGAIAASTAGMNFNQTIALETILGITLMDAFISCWDEKYRSHRIRPETFINKHIDVRWQPLLQTPPFPEYPSGHSVVSTAAAEVLSYLAGDNLPYVDDSEIMFEIPPRNFTSFRQAADEASISRLYGGIHFMDAISQGQEEGRRVGQHIIEKLRKSGMTSFRK